MSSDKSRLNIDIVMSMRAQDLRNLLIQKFGLERDYIYKIIDKDHLREIAVQQLELSEASRLQSESWQKIAAAVAVVALSVWIAKNYYTIQRYFTIKKLSKWYKRSYYKQFTRMKMLKYSWVNRVYDACFFFVLAMLCEVYSFALQISTLLSWIVPSYIYYYHFKFPSLSIPLSSSMLSTPLGDATNSSGVGVDVGPMATSWILMWIVHKLDNLAAEKMRSVMSRNDHMTWRTAPRRQVQREDANGRQIHSYDGMSIPISQVSDTGEEYFTEEEIRFFSS